MKIGQYCQASIVSDNVVSMSNWSYFWQTFASRGFVSDSWAFLFYIVTLKYYKPVDELACALPSFKRLLLSVDVIVGMYDSIERYPV